MSLFGDGFIFFFEAATKTFGPRRRMEDAKRKGEEKSFIKSDKKGCIVRKRKLNSTALYDMIKDKEAKPVLAEFRAGRRL